MNKPPYILVNEMRAVVEATRIALRDASGNPDLWPVLHYEHGYVNELNETLMQYAKTPTYAVMKFPLVWVAQPFTVQRGEYGMYGKTNDLRIFIVMETKSSRKATERQSLIYEPVIYPIYQELLVQIKKSKAFSVPQVSLLKHSVTDRYFWGREQQSVLNDVVDCMEISGINLVINNNTNCPTSGLVQTTDAN